MDARQINRIMKKVPGFVGVFPRDELPLNQRRRPFGFVANTDKSDMPGQHWVAFHFAEDGIGEYFDSYGLPPLFPEFADYLFENAPNGHFHNKATLQCTTCLTCGHYCVLFLITRLNGGSFIDFLNLFTNNPTKNDMLIKSYFNIFNH